MQFLLFWAVTLIVMDVLVSFQINLFPCGYIASTPRHCYNDTSWFLQPTYRHRRIWTTLYQIQKGNNNVYCFLLKDQLFCFGSHIFLFLGFSGFCVRRSLMKQYTKALKISIIQILTSSILSKPYRNFVRCVLEAHV